jgi:hypothetical protein
MPGLSGLFKLWATHFVKKVPKMPDPPKVKAPKKSVSERIEELKDDDQLSLSYLKYLVGRAKEGEHLKGLIDYLTNPTKTINLSADEVKLLLKMLLKKKKMDKLISSTGEWFV